MRAGFLAAVALVAAIGLSGCGLFGGDNSSKDSKFSGSVVIGMTDNVPTTGNYTVQNIYNPNVRNIIAVVDVTGAKAGDQIEGQWYQMHVFEQIRPKPKAGTPTPGPEGTLITKAGFTVKNGDQDQGRITLTPNSPLPEDSYELRVYANGQLVKVQPFVVSVVVPGPSPANSTTTSPTPVRTATPSR